MMAEAEAAKILALAEAQAKGVLLLRQAEASGYKAISDALAAIPNAPLVLEFARLHALQKIAESLADGKATKLFLPNPLQGLLGLAGAAQAATTSVE
jgi:regulator of protease activity HflC (stomatin/prohibitin superfamily)